MWLSDSSCRAEISLQKRVLGGRVTATAVAHVDASSDLFFSLIAFILRYSPFVRILLLHVILNERPAFHSIFLNIHQSGVLTVMLHGRSHVKLLLSWHVMCIPRNHAPYHVTSYKATYMRCTCLAATGHLHVWQNDQELLHATVVTWGWNGYRNKSQHRKLTPKKILPSLLLGLKPMTLPLGVQHSNH